MAATYRVEQRPADGFPAWVLHDDANDLHATFVPAAGMLGASLEHKADELLWTGAGVATYARERKFMGIPFLHPWANRLAGFTYRAGGREVALERDSHLLLLDDNGLPIHGLLTASRLWSIREAAADGDCARITAALDFDDPELLAFFPFPHRVEIEVRLAAGALQLRTTVTATAAESVPIAFGFHPYLCIPGIDRSQWEVSFPVHRRVCLDDRQIPTGATEPTGPISGVIGGFTWDDEFDRIDHSRPFELHAGERTVAVEYTDGYPVAQIYAPPGQQYVCIEPMTARTNSLVRPSEALRWCPPGESRAATFRIVTRGRSRPQPPASRLES